VPASIRSGLKTPPAVVTVTMRPASVTVIWRSFGSPDGVAEK
jgi:hypothetical protein